MRITGGGIGISRGAEVVSLRETRGELFGLHGVCNVHEEERW